jgi:protein-S-isoprenylcysteine O-methyltransferase Ste14
LNPWFGKAAFIAAMIGYSVIRAPHGRRSGTVPVTEVCKGTLDILLLLGVFFCTLFLPLVWVVMGFPAGADYTLHPVPYALGLGLLVTGLWLFHRSHADLGTNWSVTLQLRQNHHLVTTGIYERIRHPMYTSFFLISIAHVLFLPNWIVGPVYLLSFTILYVVRVGKEEQMMLDRFGMEYEAYMQRTGRLIPLWAAGHTR